MNGLVIPQRAIPMVWTPYGWMPMSIPEYPPDTDIWFAIPVTNNSDSSLGTVDVKIRARVHQGAHLYGTTGDELEAYESSETPVPNGQTVTVGVPGGENNHTTRDIGGMAERDLSIDLLYKDASGEWQMYAEDERFYDLYMVTAAEYGFIIGQPEVREA